MSSISRQGLVQAIPVCMFTVMTAAFLVFLVLSTSSGEAHWLFAAGNFPLGYDFYGFHVAGRMVSSGLPITDVYDISTFSAYQREVSGHATALIPYPPTAFLVFVPFSLPSYPIAVSLWTALGCVSLAFSIRRLAPGMAPYVLGGTGIWIAVALGQVSLFAAAALAMATAAWLDGRWRECLIILGLLTCLKVQLGAPVMLILSVLAITAGDVRAVLAGITTVLVTALAATAIFGPDCWAGFASALQVANTSYATTTDANALANVISWGGAARLLGFSSSVANICTAASCIAALGVIAVACLYSTSKANLLAVVLFACFLVPPYVSISDAVVLAVSCVLLARSGALGKVVGYPLPLAVLAVAPLLHMMSTRMLSMPTIQIVEFALATASVVCSLRRDLAKNRQSVPCDTLTHNESRR